MHSALMVFRNRAKTVVREMFPAHYRFVRSGKAFLIKGEPEVRELPGLVEKGSIALDVGAHIGEYTYALAQLVGTGGRVIAVEPIPPLARFIERACQRLHLPVTVYNCALSNTGGEANLFLPGNRTGFATLESRGAQGQSYRVPLRTLDQICRGLTGRISFLKVDVEGHELKVFEGAVETLNRHRPNLLVEIEQRHSNQPVTGMFQHLAALGYEGHFLGPNGEHVPISKFDVEEHQTRQIDADGQPMPGYVNNFIFQPTGK
jgi:FkbM family methyltransferase